PKAGTIVLAEISTRLSGDQLDAKFDAARNNRNLSRSDLENPQFRMQPKAAQLWHKEKFAVSSIEKAISHALRHGIEMDSDSRVHRRIAISRQRNQAVDEIRRLRG